jgi:hypothetical protein
LGGGESPQLDESWVMAFENPSWHGPRLGARRPVIRMAKRNL